MQSARDELPQAYPFQIDQLLVEGRYTPSAQELVESLSKLDLVEEFKDTIIVDRGIFTLSFDSADHAHLFALNLGAQGHSNNIFYFGLSDSIFQTDLLDEYRPDGVVLSLSESKKSDRSEISVVLRQGSEEYRKKLTELVKEVVSSSIPHLADDVSSLIL